MKVMEKYLTMSIEKQKSKVNNLKLNPYPNSPYVIPYTTQEANIIRQYIDYLNSEYETTATEDFLAQGWKLDGEALDVPNGIIIYRKGIKIIELNEHKTYFNFDETRYTEMANFSLCEIEVLKPIIEKNRKEVGWSEVKHEL